jgi:hypothetical protein
MKTVQITQQEDGMFTVQSGAEPEQVFDSLDGLVAALPAMFGGEGLEPPMPMEGTQEVPPIEKPMMEGESDFVAGFKKSRGIDQGY